jgi:hypothetical protein
MFDQLCNVVGKRYNGKGRVGLFLWQWRLGLGHMGKTAAKTEPWDGCFIGAYTGEFAHLVYCSVSFCKRDHDGLTGVFAFA